MLLRIPRSWRLIAQRPGRLSVHRVSFGRPYSDTRIQIRPNQPPAPPGPDHEPAEQEYSEAAEQTFRLVLRFFKYVAIGSAGISALLFTAWEGAHQYVEHWELAAVSSGSADPFEWSRERERWTGPESSRGGGTDPRLGWRGRRIVHAAWFALNWRNDDTASVIDSVQEDSNAPTFDPNLKTALGHLTAALSIANNMPNPSSRRDGVLDPTVLDLLTLQANVLEKIGTRETLTAALSSYRQIYDSFVQENQTPEVARTAVKVGDVCIRLGDNEEAIIWWKRSLEHSKAEGFLLDDVKLPDVLSFINTNVSSHTSLVDNAPFSPFNIPSSPYEQRTVISALLSLSAHYARTHQLQDALAIEYSALQSIPYLPRPSTPSSVPSTSMRYTNTVHDRDVHELFMTLRASLLQIHMAEVLYAISASTKLNFKSLASRVFPSSSSTPSSTPSLILLQDASRKAEQVCRSLTGTAMAPTDAPRSPIPDASLLPVLSESRTLSKPAQALLRQSKRAIAQSLNLSGLLLEEVNAKEALEESLDCFERALAWAGGQDGIEEEGDVIESEWKGIWGNYVRVREKVLRRSENVK